MRFATIDIGTNSVRLFVGEKHGEQIQPIHTQLTITRLGQRVDQTGVLQQAAMERTCEAVASYQDVLSDYGIQRVLLLATSAVRDGVNRADFAALVKERTGLSLQILSGDEEAQASFLGAVLALKGKLDLSQSLSVLDIGGGSTELFYGSTNGQVYGGGSSQVGAVRMTEGYLTEHPITTDQQQRMEDVIKDRLTPLVNQCPQTPGMTLIGVGGTVTTVAAMELKLTKYDAMQVTGFRLTRPMVQDWLARLIWMDMDSRTKLPGMCRGREDVIVAGVSILKLVMEMLTMDEVVVSDGDLLQGAIYLGKTEIGVDTDRNLFYNNSCD